MKRFFSPLLFKVAEVHSSLSWLTDVQWIPSASFMFGNSNSSVEEQKFHWAMKHVNKHP